MKPNKLAKKTLFACATIAMMTLIVSGTASANDVENEAQAFGCKVYVGWSLGNVDVGVIGGEPTAKLGEETDNNLADCTAIEPPFSCDRFC